MIQEVITYMIIGSAVTLAALKVWKRFAPKKKQKRQTSQPNASGTHEHNCAACSAECQLRDLPKYVIEKNLDECIQVEKKSQLLQS